MIINYGIHKNYLSHWNINHALREIMQNFLDYGEYTLNSENINDTFTKVKISNTYKPDNLNFLAIGLSIKQGEQARGKYGEGLKMAMLIFERESLPIKISINNKEITPIFQNTEIGNTLCLNIEEVLNKEEEFFTIEFQIETKTWEVFINNVITSSDIIFSDNYYGSIVNKPQGKLYCGNLFVCDIPNLKQSYNLSPRHLKLDRDRMTPTTFDVNWATSKINEAYGKLSLKDTTFDDYAYISKVPVEIKRQLKPINVGNSTEFIYKDEKGKTVVLRNQHIKQELLKDNFFSRAIKRLKLFLAKQLGIYDLLVEFQKKYIHDEQAKLEFEIILEKVKGE